MGFHQPNNLFIPSRCFNMGEVRYSVPQKEEEVSGMEKNEGDGCQMDCDEGANDLDLKLKEERDVGTLDGINKELYDSVSVSPVEPTEKDIDPVDVDLGLMENIQRDLRDWELINLITKLDVERNRFEIVNTYITYNEQFKRIYELSKGTKSEKYPARIVFKAYMVLDFEGIRRLIGSIMEGKMWADPWLIKKILGLCIVKKEYQVVKSFCESSEKFVEEYSTEYAVALASSGDLDYSEQIFYRRGGVHENGKPGRNDYYVYLAALFRYSRLSKAMGVYGSFIEEGHPHSIILVNQILSRLVYEKLLDQAQEFYQLHFEQSTNPDTLQFSGLKPNSDTFSKIVIGFADLSQPSLAMTYLDKMYDLGLIDPQKTRKIWEHLLHMSVSGRSLAKKETATAILRHMRSKFPTPATSRNLSVHTILSRILTRDKLERRSGAGRDTLVNLLGSLGPEFGISRCEKSYALVAHHLSDLGAHHLFPILIDNIVKIEGKVSSSVFVVALRSCFEAQDPEILNEVMSRLKSYDVFINRRLYFCIVSGLYHSFKIDAAAQAYLKMRQAGHSPILTLATKLLLVLKRNGRKDTVAWLVDDTLGHSEYPGRLTTGEISKFESLLSHLNRTK